MPTDPLTRTRNECGSSIEHSGTLAPAANRCYVFFIQWRAPTANGSTRFPSGDLRGFGAVSKGFDPTGARCIRPGQFGSNGGTPVDPGHPVGVNTGMAMSDSSVSTKRTSTLVPIDTESGAHSTMFVIIRGPSSNSTYAKISGRSSSGHPLI